MHPARPDIASHSIAWPQTWQLWRRISRLRLRENIEFHDMSVVSIRWGEVDHTTSHHLTPASHPAPTNTALTVWPGWVAGCAAPPERSYRYFRTQRGTPLRHKDDPALTEQNIKYPKYKVTDFVWRTCQDHRHSVATSYVLINIDIAVCNRTCVVVYSVHSTGLDIHHTLASSTPLFPLDREIR